jgi:hypothetical protein
MYSSSITNSFVSNAVFDSSERYSIANRVSSIDWSSEDPGMVSNYLLSKDEIYVRFPSISCATAA